MSVTDIYTNDHALLEALRKESPGAFEKLYRQYYRMVAKQVSDAGAAGLDAEDLFQELLVILVRKVRDPEFELTSKLSTFLFAIARNLIFKSMGKQTEFSTGDIALFQREVSQPQDELEEREKRELLLTIVAGNLEIMGEDCRELLKLSFYEKQPQVVIAEKMGYAEAFVKVKKHRCLDYLRKQVKAHPSFQNL